MTSAYLPVFMSNALYENDEVLDRFLTGNVDLREALDFSQRFRIAAIGSLLTSGTADYFHSYLHKSASGFIHFLSTKLRAWPGSKAAPFFDAVACGDDHAAQKLAQACPAAADLTSEYEEDFLYVRFLIDQFFLGATVPDGRFLLERYEVVLDGSEDPRLDVLRALLQADSEGFDAALGRLMEAHDIRWKKMAEKESLPPDVLATEGTVSVEGLALVRFATTKGLAISDNHLFIPSIARMPGERAYYAEDWKIIQPQ
jgi:hypothetical protein